jgi:DNA polymerase III subunit beta
MKFTVQKDHLVKAVQDVMRAVSSRTTIPILTGIKLVVTNEGLTLTGSDSDISIESYLPTIVDDQQLVDVKQPGSIVLNARYFSDIVKKLPADFVELESDSHYVTTIRAGKTEFSLNGFDAEEYPLLPQIEEHETISISADLLKFMI